MSARARRGWALAAIILASGGIGYGLRSAFPPYPALTTPVVIDEALWRAILSGPPVAGVFAVIAFTPAIRSTKIARENAAREQWWNRAQWALGLAASDDQEDREVANDALQALLEDATPTEGKMIYRTIKKLLADGKVRAIGVSNFMPDVLERLLAETSVVPAVNQIELHPFFQQKQLQALHAEHGILTQAWSPIGGVASGYGSGGTSALEDPTIVEIAKEHGKSPAQVMLRWHVQEGRSAIPKSTKAHRIAENFDVFDFELTPQQLASIDALDTGVRSGPEPDSITLENYGMPIPEA